MFKGITRTIWFVSLVSLFTDMASEMLYPVMPVYLKTIGYSVLIIGLLEGFAEAVAGLGKSYFGRLSDASGKRLPFVQLGYLFSAISKPMLAISTQLWWIFLARFADRAGKGLRTAPRDAMLNAEATVDNKATVFGFHRSMDTLGAVLGPLLTLIFLYYYPGKYHSLFLLAAVPGLVAVLFTLLLKEKKTVAEKKAIPFHQTFSYWKHSPIAYRKLISGLLLFALFNSSDVFLLLKMKEAGLSDAALIAVYIFYNLVYALFAFPIGKLADKTGIQKVFLGGLFFFAITYTGFAFADNTTLFLLLFTCYGIYAAATESVAKAWISSLVPSTENASAIGLFTGLQSVATLLASSLAGFLWFRFNASVVFFAAALAAIVVLLWLRQQTNNHK
ncbi:MFS transporter [Lacibacter luteus]|uniref:MFS transporter n=1 Tax=Lacibacter luteus TaxID=2508719 RepID=A0A4Q1CF35_9BACT|nr:MFS transporter [Lacibacter luteus]RXK58293.1 MFS transporter [Lacibacter luteus]